jgi:hypothetical protein
VPLTKKGKKVMGEMKDEYGPEKGERVFYATVNTGKLRGVHEGQKKRTPPKKK